MAKEENIKIHKQVKKGKNLIHDIKDIIILFDEKWIYANSESEDLKIKVVEETLQKIRAAMFVAFINGFQDCEAYLPSEIKTIIKRQESIIEDKQETLHYN